MTYVIVPAHLLALGYGPSEVGLVVTAAMLGSAAATSMMGILGRWHAPQQLLVVAALVMTATGIAYASTTGIALLVFVAAIGTLNLTAGDVSVFLPLEQTALANATDADDRPRVMARFDMVGVLIGAAGSLVAGLPLWIADRTDQSDLTAHRWSFMSYSVAGVLALVLYRRLPQTQQRHSRPNAAVRSRLDPIARRRITRLTVLFSLDSFASGFASHAVISLWLYRRFDLDPAVVGAVFAATGLMSAVSAQLSPYLARRIGPVATMVATHAPASVLLIGVAFAPTSGIAIALLIVRGITARMDVPIRTSHVMSVVAPEHRSIAAAITNVPRSLAAALPAVIAGTLIARADVAWPLVVCATLKLVYDAALWIEDRRDRAATDDDSSSGANR